VIAAKGEDTWWTTPDGLIGTGPFALRAWARKQSLEFAPVPNWWGGPTGTLKRVHVDVVGDIGDQINKYRKGQADLIGYGESLRFSPELPALAQFAKDPTHARELVVTPYLKTTWVAFNVETGAFGGIEEGRLGRLAFSQSIDRKQLVDRTCDGGTTCLAAAGGLITKGLAGYLGDDRDQNAKFDPVAAQANYKRWDPDESKVRDLRLSFTPSNRAIADNLRAQWKANLGVDVGLDQADAQTFGSRLRKKSYALAVRGWIADWNGPDDWFDSLFTTNAPDNGGYSDPRFDTVVRAADARPSSEALPDYVRAGEILVEDVAYAALAYGIRAYLVKPYVRGAAGNALYEYPWGEVKILRH
jgi:oligopeptide transport system substrate-binding protein